MPPIVLTRDHAAGRAIAGNADRQRTIVLGRGSARYRQHLLALLAVILIMADGIAAATAEWTKVPNWIMAPAAVAVVLGLCLVLELSFREARQAGITRTRAVGRSVKEAGRALWHLAP